MEERGSEETIFLMILKVLVREVALFDDGIVGFPPPVYMSQYGTGDFCERVEGETVDYRHDVLEDVKECRACEDTGEAQFLAVFGDDGKNGHGEVIDTRRR